MSPSKTSSMKLGVFKTMLPGVHCSAESKTRQEMTFPTPWMVQRTLLLMQHLLKRASEQLWKSCEKGKCCEGS